MKGTHNVSYNLFCKYNDVVCGARQDMEMVRLRDRIWTGRVWTGRVGGRSTGNAECQGTYLNPLFCSFSSVTKELPEPGLPCVG